MTSIRRFGLMMLAAGMLATGCTSGSETDGGLEPNDPITDPDPEPEEIELPSHVTVTLHGALVRPWDANDELWDDSKQIEPADVAALAEALQAPEPYVAVGKLIADGFIDHWAPPDPYGSARVFSEGVWLSDQSLGTPDTNFDNTLSPLFDASWAQLPMQEDLRVQVTLIDEDDFLGGADDPMGTVVLDYDALVEAYAHGGNAPIQVSDQGNGTILFINLSVAPSTDDSA